MSATSLGDSRSALYRKQIENIASNMRKLISQTLLKPLFDMARFTGVKETFLKTENEAYSNCTDLDAAHSIGDEDSASDAVMDSMTELVHLKNDARNLIEKEPMG